MTSDFDAEHVMQAVQLSRLRDTYADLDRWRERSRHLEEPQLGSEMDSDTAATHGMGVPLPSLVRHPLISGTQHLNLARTSVEGGKEVFPIAHSTALRGALLGASHGVWLLHPCEPSVRRVRAARVAREMHKRLLEWIREPHNGLDPEDRREAEELCNAQYGELSRREDVLALQYSDTSVIKGAAAIVFSDAHQSGAVVALWRQLSGDAHGLLWTTMTRESTVRSRAPRDTRYPSRMIEIESGGDLRTMVDDFWAAYRILKVGWSLFDQRCTAP